MTRLKDTRTLVTAALLAAFTCIATMVIQIPTPTLGYIHPGDCLVLLSGVILGPVLGGFTAGIGSMLADLLSGYAIYVIPTFIIKALTACIAGYLFRYLQQKKQVNHYPALIVAGLCGEINVVCGYFLNTIVKTMVLSASYSKETFAAGFTSAITGIAPNVLQGAVGIVLALALFPILSKVPDIRAWMNSPS
ncbi:MAG: ECF transporter S component [Lachnospiraceae bacterium]